MAIVSEDMAIELSQARFRETATLFVCGEGALTACAFSLDTDGLAGFKARHKERDYISEVAARF